MSEFFASGGQNIGVSVSTSKSKKTQTQQTRAMEMEAKAGVMLSQSRDCLKPPGTGGGRTDPPTEPLEAV